MQIKWRVSNNFTGRISGQTAYNKSAAHLKYITRSKECLEFEHISRNFENLEILSDRYKLGRDAMEETSPKKSLRRAGKKWFQNVEMIWEPTL